MDLIVRNATLRGVKGTRDLGVQEGMIQVIEEHIVGGASREIDARGRLLVPGFVNIHCHLDKCLTGAWAEVWEKSGSGSPEAIPAATKVKEKFTEEDIAERASRALSTSVLAGATAVRAFADVDTIGGLRSVKGLLKVKERFKSALEIQIVAFPQEGIFRDEGTDELLEKSLELGADVVGAMPWYEKSTEAAKGHVDFAFDLGRKYGKDIHALIDDNSDPNSRNIEYLLARTIKESFEGRVSASHCRGGLDSPDQEYAEKIVRMAKEADITVVENSHVSLFMYGRTDAHPVRRGVTRVREFLQGGVNVAIGQDDIDDPYYPFGRGDMLELAFIMCHAAHLGTPAEMESAFDMVGPNPAKGMRLERYGIGVGDHADLVLLDAKNVHEALRLQPERLAVIKRGRLVAESRPHRELHV